MSCPKCRSERMHKSRRFGIIERKILAVILVRPFRCESCDHRFFRWSLTGEVKVPSSQPAATR